GGSVGLLTQYDYVTVKYNSAGQQQWTAGYTGPVLGDDIATALKVDASGNVYVTGHSFGGSGTIYDYATIKYDSTGQQQWVARYNGPVSDDDESAAIAIDGSGNVYVTGYSAASHSFFDSDYATIKYVQGQVCDSGTIVNGGFETGDLIGWL